MAELLAANSLPGEFCYPREFLRVIEYRITDIEPWEILQGESLTWRQGGLADRYPLRSLVGFAVRVDNDDVACWDVAEGDVVIVHDFASAGWEQRARYPDFRTWFLQAIDEFLYFE